MAEAEDIAEGVAEPRDLRTAGSSPDGERVRVVHARVAVEVDSRIEQALDLTGDVCDVPAEDGERLRFELADKGGSEGDAVQIEDKGEGRFIGEQREAELIAIEGESFVLVCDGNERDERGRGERCGGSHGVARVHGFLL